ncbi:50S ribosomal protein L18 [Planctomycetes bacterium Pla163]|uniref:Large ribosomal subunit protein uL18 n=1 Tax=Rohdeia mirabilis TaxID=2528008 RepID=A0A518D2S6_9BACT|nr:50S ribosomal protein L18 [Planctomycetes bacterium Pla163]
MKPQASRNARNRRRKGSVRATIRRTADRPRLSVHRSGKHIYAQVIDDASGRTLCAASSVSKAFQGDNGSKTKTETAVVIGTEIARLAKDAGVEKVVFDRGAARYHGRIKALADAAREGGLTF